MFEIKHVQPADDDDAFAFAANSWLKSYQHSVLGGDDANPPRDMTQYFIRRCPSEVYYSAMRPYVTAELRRGFMLGVVEDADKEPLFAGFAYARAGSLHYVYVKKWLRRTGLANQLVQALAPTTYCNQTRPWVDAWLQRHGLTYQPQEAFRARTDSTAA